MNIDELLNLLDETLEEAPSLPLSGGKRIVDIEKSRDIIDDVRLALPSEIRQAKAIVNDRVDIITVARKEAEAIIKKAEEKARAMVAEQEIVKASQQKAQEITTAANAQAREMRASTADYCEGLLRQTEEALVRNVQEVKNVRAALKQKTGV